MRPALITLIVAASVVDAGALTALKRDAEVLALDLPVARPIGLWYDHVATPGVVEGARPEMASAEARLRLVEVELAKTRLPAPFDGRVLRIHAEPGELVLTAPQAILPHADMSRRRVREFVEELDAARVRRGQRAKVSTGGLPGEEFSGEVGEVAPRMGRRSLPSVAPGACKDLDFREIMIDLDAGEELPLNPRVQVAEKETR